MLNLTLGTNIIQQVREHRVLGITIDEELKRQPHIDNIRKQVAQNLFLPGQLRKYVDIDCRKLFFNAHLMAHINYASTVWRNASEVHLKKSTPSTDEQQNLYYLITPCLKNLRNWTFFHCRNNLCTTQLCLFMFKVHMGWAPQYVCDLLNRAPARYE